MWGLTVSDYGVISWMILILVFLEGLLSADNALVLAVMVRHLPRDQQKRALRYGIFGAFGFRLIAVLCASMLLEYWIVKVIGGLYLLYLAISHLVFAEESHEGTRKSRFGSGFWGTVVGVELADIAFSIDSILAAVAMADSLPDAIEHKVLFVLPISGMAITWKLLTVYIGGILGIIAMRFVAGYFLRLLDRFAGLAVGAYYLVAWIGLKLVGSGLHNALNPPLNVPRPAWHDRMPGWVFRVPLEMSDWLFWSMMGLIVLASFLVKPKQPPATVSAEQPLTESEILA